MDTLGLIETRTITSGVRVLDVMLKAADVRLLKGSSICSGRYMIQVTGTRDAVQTSVRSAVEKSSDVVADFILSRVSSRVLAALKQRYAIDPGLAVGMVEARRAICGIAAADKAVKQADVTLCRMAIANGINGKSYIVFSGRVSSIHEAVNTASAFLEKDLVDALVLPNPDPGVIKALVPMGITRPEPQVTY